MSFLFFFGAIHEPFPSFVSDTAKCYSKLRNSNSSHSLRACVAKPVGARSTVWEGADDGIKLKSSDCVTSQLAIGRNLPKKKIIYLNRWIQNQTAYGLACGRYVYCRQFECHIRHMKTYRFFLLLCNLRFTLALFVLEVTTSDISELCKVYEHQTDNGSLKTRSTFVCCCKLCSFLQISSCLTLFMLLRSCP